MSSSLKEELEHRLTICSLLADGIDRNPLDSDKGAQYCAMWHSGDKTNYEWRLSLPEVVDALPTNIEANCEVSICILVGTVEELKEAMKEIENEQ